MNALYSLRDMLCNELDGIVSNSQGNIPLDIIDKVTHSLKSVEAIIAMKEGSNNSYANGNSYGGNNSYNSYNSYGGNSYSNGSYGRRSYGRSYMNRSYGDSKEEMMSELREMMNEAKSDQERQAFQQFINQMQNM